MIKQTFSVIDVDGADVEVTIDISRQLIVVGGNPLSFENARQLGQCITKLVATQDMKKTEEYNPTGAVTRYMEAISARLSSVEDRFDQLARVASGAIEKMSTDPAAQAAVKESIARAEQAVNRAGPTTLGNPEPIAGDARVMPAMPSQVRREYDDDRPRVTGGPSSPAGQGFA